MSFCILVVKYRYIKSLDLYSSSLWWVFTPKRMFIIHYFSLNSTCRQKTFDQTKKHRKQKSINTLLSLKSLLFLSISARSCVPCRALKMVFGRQTTSFCCASVISCGISGLDVPPQISRPSREACGSRQAAFPIIVLNC